jgi:RNA polymerase sigma-70 factor (ECF subfamily)
MSLQPDLADSPHPWQEDFVRLFGLNQGRVFAYIVTLVPNRADAEDVLQQTSLVIYRRFQEFDPQRDFVRWACGIAFRVALNHLKKQRRDRHVFNDDLLKQIGQERLARAEVLEHRQDALHQCLDKLTASDRKIVEHYYLSGSTTGKEVAAQLGRPVNTVLKALIRIRSNLHRCIDRVVSAGGNL